MVRNASINYLKQKVLVEKYPIEFIENIDGEEKLYTLDFALSADEETLYEELKKDTRSFIYTTGKIKGNFSFEQVQWA